MTDLQWFTTITQLDRNLRRVVRRTTLIYQSFTIEHVGRHLALPSEANDNTKC